MTEQKPILKTVFYSDFIANEMSIMRQSDELDEKEKQRTGAEHFTHLINSRIIPLGPSEAQFLLEQEWANNDPTCIRINENTELSGLTAFPKWPKQCPDQIAILLSGVSLGEWAIPSIFVSRITNDNDLYAKSLKNTFHRHGIPSNLDVTIGDEHAQKKHWVISCRIPNTEQLLSSFHVISFSGANIDALIASCNGNDYDAICKEIGINLDCKDNAVKQVVFEAHRLALAVIHHYSLPVETTVKEEEILFEGSPLAVKSLALVIPEQDGA